MCFITLFELFISFFIISIWQNLHASPMKIDKTWVLPSDEWQKLGALLKSLKPQ